MIMSLRENLLMNEQANFKCDVLIIGSGAAGLSLALRLPPSLNIAVLSKGDLRAASTYHAQGGVAAVLDRDDSIEAHINDTLEAGAGLCDKAAVAHTCQGGPEAVQWLIDRGVHFTTFEKRSGETYHLNQEGGHSFRRILHAADATGAEISNTLISCVQAQKNIHLFKDRVAIDVIHGGKLNRNYQGSSYQGADYQGALGAYVFNKNTASVEVFQAKVVVLATGGASKSYLYTSNPDIATGDGVAMAWRAGCRVANMEFNQFHPTCLYYPGKSSYLITEAIRGEGGLLKLPNGERFMQNFHPKAELAPRDIVARAIDHEMKRLGADHLYLDITHKGEAFIKEQFPNIYQHCLSLGIDISKQAIPVVPAAHYTCGGVMTDLNGQTDIEGLYAIGETAFTGLHGANRMASNSLLECLVFAKSAAESIVKNIHKIPEPSALPRWDESQVSDSDEAVVISHNWDELRRFMWDYVGIVRTDKRLARALSRVELLQREINEYYSHFKITNDLLELRNLAQVSELIIRCALQRKESRGLHYNLDYPNLLEKPVNSVLKP
jgi:L-aspartate oxidase